MNVGFIEDGRRGGRSPQSGQMDQRAAAAAQWVRDVPRRSILAYLKVVEPASHGPGRAHTADRPNGWAITEAINHDLL